MTGKVDSNITGVRIAEEESYKTLPATPVWYPYEPDSYPDFGGETVTEARNPMNPSRQNQKGSVVDLNANAGLSQDLTMALPRLFQGFCFADAREKMDTQPLNGTAIAITNVDSATSDYDAASGLDGFKVNDLVYASGFNDPANNGLKTVTAAAAAALTVAEALVDEVPSADARLEAVGFNFPDADVNIDVSNTLPRLTSTATDMTTLGLIAGEWVYLGGDATANRFSTLVNRGWCRINAIGTNYIEFDKTDSTFEDETGTGKQIHLFMGKVIKNEKDPTLINRKTYTFERSLGTIGTDPQGEYVNGCVANQLSLNVTVSSKTTVDLNYVGAEVDFYRNAAERKNGDRPENPGYHTYNSASHFQRLRVATLDPSTSNPTPLLGFMDELSLTIDNGVTPNKAITVLGSFDVSAGNFNVGGSISAYFTDVASVQAVQNNDDITLDCVIVAQNKGFVFDIPLLSFGNGRLDVSKDEPIKLPLENKAAEGKFGSTLMIGVYHYLPDLTN